MSDIEKARSALRQALGEHDSARAARDEAKASLARADAVVAHSIREVAERTKARDDAEARHAGEIAGAIRRSVQPDATPPAFVSQAQHALTQSESRHRMAKTARETLAAELANAEASVKRIDASIRAAAYAVIIAEARPLVEKIAAAKTELLAAYDALVGLGSLGMHVVAGSLPSLPPDLRNAMTEAKSLEYPLGLIRPPAIMGATTPEGIAAARWRDYMAALISDPEASFADVPTPKPALRLTIPAFNEIHASRVAAASKVGVG